ncbi:hypothetical protein HDU93_001902, partial [Gonapodya sp. JEL0774]
MYRPVSSCAAILFAAILIAGSHAAGITKNPHVGRHPMTAEDPVDGGSPEYFALKPVRPTIQYTPGRRSMIADITVYIVFYGNWPASSQAIVKDFIRGLDSSDFWDITS